MGQHTLQEQDSVKGYRNWPRYGLRWSGLCCYSRHSTSGAGRRLPAPQVLCREWQHKTAQRRPYEWSISILPRKRSITQRLIQRRSWRWATMLKRPGWQRHCDHESVHRYSGRIIDQCDVTIASGSHIDDVTIAKLLTFEIILAAARNERYGFRLSKTTWRFNYKWAVVFCNGEYHQTLNSRPWWHRFSNFRNRKNLRSLESFGKWRHVITSTRNMHG